MSDITIVWVPALGQGDWVISGALLKAGNDLVTSVLLSLFTDRQAASDDIVPDGTTDPRGWWGDVDPDYPTGSRLWLLSRAKATNDTLSQAQDYITEALQWLIDDGVAANIDITTQWTAPSMLGAQVVIYRTDGSAPVAVNFASVWQNIN